VLYLTRCIAAQFAVGSVLALTMWTLGLHGKPKVDKDLVPPSHVHHVAQLAPLLWSQMPCAISYGEYRLFECVLQHASKANAAHMHAVHGIHTAL
jgi:hypothetical protein